MNCKSSTSNPIEVSFVAKSQFETYLSEREEVEFQLITGSGGFNLSIVLTEVRHKIDVYVRMSCCDTGRHAIMMHISAF